ncbi:MAG: alpha/beta hydrolase [Alphaproteobacteria bacterium]|nr:MAG: alpha/beta hydrolase [Alphaproteobacteria bacterium]
MDYREKYFKSNDGLDLYYREYGEGGEKCPLVCLSGITRNSGDFHDFALRYSKDRKVYALDYRGRGKSAYDPDYSQYNPQVYVGDVYAFLMQKEIPKACFVGTSLGGLLTMAFAGLAKQFIAAAILNDVGPEVDTKGGGRILDYIGKDVRFSSLAEAVSVQKATYGIAYPDLTDEDWMKQTAVSFIPDKEAGNYRLNYDLKIGQALADQMAAQEPVDLWPFFKALNDVPTLVIRGALSDILSPEVFEKMKIENPAMEWLELANRGHVPLLNEPEALSILDRFIARI